MWMAVCFLLLSMRIASTLWMLTSTGLSVYLTLCNVSDPRETQTAHALPPCQMLLGTLPVYVCALRAEAGGSGHSFLCRFAFCIDWIDSNHAFMARRVGLDQKSADLPLDLPKELVLDVNKAPYPVVNIIADQSVGSVRALSALAQQRKTEKTTQADFRAEVARQEASFGEVLQKQEAQLQVRVL